MSEKTNTKTVVITGVTGYIGSHTALAFKQAGYRVIGIDREHTIPESLDYVDVFFKKDFVDSAAMIAVGNYENIVHIAGTSLVGPSLLDPSEYYDNNTAKTNKFLADLVHAGWKGTILFSSSAAVYGEAQSYLDENSIKNPISPYGRSKLMAEWVIADYCRSFGVKGLALRYFNACGADPEGRLGNVWSATHLIPSLLRSVLENKTFMLNGADFDTPDGTCVRDYLHVSDIARAHVKAIELAQSIDTHSFRAYNLGTGTGRSNLEVLRSLEHSTQTTINYEIGPRREGDPALLISLADSFKSATGWKPEHSDIETIAETATRWMKLLNQKR